MTGMIEGQQNAVTTAEVAKITDRLVRGETSFDDIIKAATNDRTGKQAFSSLDPEKRQSLLDALDAAVATEQSIADEQGSPRPDRIGLLWAAARVFYGENSPKYHEIGEKLRPYIRSDKAEA